MIRRPVWFLNLCAEVDWKSPDRLYAMAYFSPLILEWLDHVRVKGDPDNEGVCRAILKLWNRYADWTKLTGECGALREVAQVHRRVKGLVSLEIHDR